MAKKKKGQFSAKKSLTSKLIMSFEVSFTILVQQLYLSVDMMHEIQ